MTPKPHSCGSCPARWSGANTCHCAADGCHLTFAGITAFDFHQVRHVCLTERQLASRGYVEVRPGVIGRPTPAETPKDGRL